MFCSKRRQVDPKWQIQKFPINALWTELAKHCEEVHPAGFESLVKLSPAALAETRERLLRLDHTSVRGKK